MSFFDVARRLANADAQRIAREPGITISHDEVARWRDVDPTERTCNDVTARRMIWLERTFGAAPPQRDPVGAEDAPVSPAVKSPGHALCDVQADDGGDGANRDKTSEAPAGPKLATPKEWLAGLSPTSPPSTLTQRLLDCLEALLDACPQSGPDARDLDVDHAALAVVVADATALLFESGRRLP